MKFKATLSGQDQPFIDLQFGNLFKKKKSYDESNFHLDDDSIGRINCTHLIGKDILILDLEMNLSQAQTIEAYISGESILLNFIGCNKVEPKIDKVESEKYTIENTHNILYTNSLHATYKLPAFEEINYLSIIVSIEKYEKLINGDWSLHPPFSDSIKQKKSGYISPNHAPFTADMQWILHEIRNCKYTGSLKKMYVESKIKELLILQLDAFKHPLSQVVIDPKDYAKLLQAKHILDNNFTNAPTLLELSRAISLNEFKLKKGFKSCFATTIKGYVTQLRMEYAKKLFKNKASNVGEVAYKCGYKDVSHFSAAFKSFYGFTPISFRKITHYTKLQLLIIESIDFLPLIELI